MVVSGRRDDSPVPRNATLLLNSEGRLVLQSTQGQDTNIAEISSPGSSASMLDSGNFVLYSSDKEIIWQSFDYPTDTLLPTQRLLAEQELFSSISETDHSTGKFRLKMQQDGNLVQYPTETSDTAAYSYWSSATNGWGANVTLNLDVDGRLYLLNSSNFNTENLTEGYNATRGIIYLAKLDSDGILRLYSYNTRQDRASTVVWESSKNKCDPKGVCGFNSFCVLNDQKPECRCLPGYSFVNQGNWTSGCERNFTAESCSKKNGSVKYMIQPLENTRWEDLPYFVLSETTKEDCQQACLVDCNCEAALF
ncbi:hypothetical protein Pint_27171 [Pistacia integerrima]|uniref:Uncharacterized protein n=1 Tax=Pistacia integerrima TaxID=434235 RepID=A0ACC0YT29_9ROSI|nr:hypothetical protein Pint_27171 [Pistacia integerrima]